MLEAKQVEESTGLRERIGEQRIVLGLAERGKRKKGGR